MTKTYDRRPTAPRGRQIWDSIESKVSPAKLIEVRIVKRMQGMTFAHRYEALVQRTETLVFGNDDLPPVRS